ncbi:MAG: hypothetical protein EPN91_05655 [Salinibacterium sp.]|nr:MAG: hypothetical protein EPN91_05655 [Salinibacterium sp.]
MFDGEFTRVTNSLGPELAKTFVVLWDIGPHKPSPPKRPDTPKGKPGQPEFDLAMIEFREQLDAYEDALKAYGRAKTEYAEWQKREGGAIERTMYSCDAHDALARDAANAPMLDVLDQEGNTVLDEQTGEPKQAARLRYFISASTRGHERLKNHGLPEGVKPGRGQAENIRRQREGEDEFLRARAADPVFGQEMTR